jgi:carbamoyl-phosphate synthase small subunit
MVNTKAQKAYIYFENGVLLEALSFGDNGTKTGEIVFNTSLSGYQEIISDPSYSGQIVCFCMSEIGIVGTNDDDDENDKAQNITKHIGALGVVVRNYSDFYSNYRGSQSLGSYLKQKGILGIYDIDTRYITAMIRDEGSLKAIISTTISDLDELKKCLNNSKNINELNLVKSISTKEAYIHKSGVWDSETKTYNKASMSDKKITVIDFGVKRNILNELANVGFEVEVIPYNFNANELISKYNSKEISAVFLSNGPGDPRILVEQIIQIKKLLDAKVKIFAICLGHQLLSIASGHNIFKLSYGHHGGNHPVINDNKVEITVQNHIYNVPTSVTKIAKVSHKNLFDETIEGLKYENVYSVQHHPEASPGSHDSKYIFKEFFKLC